MIGLRLPPFDYTPWAQAQGKLVALLAMIIATVIYTRFLTAGAALAVNKQLIQVQVHKVLKISVQIFFVEIGEKFRLCSFVDFTNAVYQFPFAHMHESL